ncbi:hypothetical protein EDEG_03667 [Edhazardia aedis USNM 41457]|uniref:Uncharacterized protein n=1 Tax=Edhazardia aedis (strain USNM 41457) TaxID=1003232 RepID=J8ZQ97_EDHAE|nr:hypothetical protein EDEG_03667 [Edhazardia aedis USNM 41457]|eukprot:EJW01868.1 hypothetical protein EDEG_03667 [Edhazardia aedis USNM 41457]
MNNTNVNKNILDNRKNTNSCEEELLHVVNTNITIIKDKIKIKLHIQDINKLGNFLKIQNTVIKSGKTQINVATIQIERKKAIIHGMGLFYTIETSTLVENILKILSDYGLLPLKDTEDNTIYRILIKESFIICENPSLYNFISVDLHCLDINLTENKILIDVNATASQIPADESVIHDDIADRKAFLHKIDDLVSENINLDIKVDDIIQPNKLAKNGYPLAKDYVYALFKEYSNYLCGAIVDRFRSNLHENANSTTMPYNCNTHQKKNCKFFKNSFQFDKNNCIFDKENDKFNNVNHQFDKNNTIFDNSNHQFDKNNTIFDNSNHQFDKNNTIFDNISHQFDKNKFIFDNNSHQFDKNNTVFDNNSHQFDKNNTIFDKTKFIFDNSSHQFDKNKFIFDNSSHQFDKNKFIFDNSSHQFDEKNTIFDETCLYNIIDSISESFYDAKTQNNIYRSDTYIHNMQKYILSQRNVKKTCEHLRTECNNIVDIDIKLEKTKNQLGGNIKARCEIDSEFYRTIISLTLNVIDIIVSILSYVFINKFNNTKLNIGIEASLDLYNFINNEFLTTLICENVLLQGDLTKFYKLRNLVESTVYNVFSTEKDIIYQPNGFFSDLDEEKNVKKNLDTCESESFMHFSDQIQNTNKIDMSSFSMSSHSIVQCLLTDYCNDIMQKITEKNKKHISGHDNTNKTQKDVFRILGSDITDFRDIDIFDILQKEIIPLTDNILNSLVYKSINICAKHIYGFSKEKKVVIYADKLSFNLHKNYYGMALKCKINNVCSNLDIHKLLMLKHVYITPNLNFNANSTSCDVSVNAYIQNVLYRGIKASDICIGRFIELKLSGISTYDKNSKSDNIWMFMQAYYHLLSNVYKKEDFNINNYENNEKNCGNFICSCISNVKQEDAKNNPNSSNNHIHHEHVKNNPNCSNNHIHHENVKNNPNCSNSDINCENFKNNPNCSNSDIHHENVKNNPNCSNSDINCEKFKNNPNCSNNHIHHENVKNNPNCSNNHIHHEKFKNNPNCSNNHIHHENVKNNPNCSNSDIHHENVKNNPNCSNSDINCENPYFNPNCIKNDKNNRKTFFSSENRGIFKNRSYEKNNPNFTHTKLKTIYSDICSKKRNHVKKCLELVLETIGQNLSIIYNVNLSNVVLVDAEQCLFVYQFFQQALEENNIFRLSSYFYDLRPPIFHIKATDIVLELVQKYVCNVYSLYMTNHNSFVLNNNFSDIYGKYEDSESFSSNANLSKKYKYKDETATNSSTISSSSSISTKTIYKKIKQSNAQQLQEEYISPDGTKCTQDKDTIMSSIKTGNKSKETQPLKMIGNIVIDETLKYIPSAEAYKDLGYYDNILQEKISEVGDIKGEVVLSVSTFDQLLLEKCVLNLTYALNKLSIFANDVVRLIITKSILKEQAVQLVKFINNTKQCFCVMYDGVVYNDKDVVKVKSRNKTITLMLDYVQNNIYNNKNNNDINNTNNNINTKRNNNSSLMNNRNDGSIFYNDDSTIKCDSANMSRSSADYYNSKDNIKNVYEDLKNSSVIQSDIVICNKTDLIEIDGRVYIVKIHEEDGIFTFEVSNNIVFMNYSNYEIDLSIYIDDFSISGKLADKIHIDGLKSKTFSIYDCLSTKESNINDKSNVDSKNDRNSNVNDVHTKKSSNVNKKRYTHNLFLCLDVNNNTCIDECNRFFFYDSTDKVSDSKSGLKTTKKHNFKFLINNKLRYLNCDLLIAQEGNLRAFYVLFYPTYYIYNLSAYNIDLQVFNDNKRSFDFFSVKCLPRNKYGNKYGNNSDRDNICGEVIGHDYENLFIDDILHEAPLQGTKQLGKNIYSENIVFLPVTKSEEKVYVKTVPSETNEFVEVGSKSKKDDMFIVLPDDKTIYFTHIQSNKPYEPRFIDKKVVDASSRIIDVTNATKLIKSLRNNTEIDDNGKNNNATDAENDNSNIKSTICNATCNQNGNEMIMKSRVNANELKLYFSCKNVVKKIHQTVYKTDLVEILIYPPYIINNFTDHTIKLGRQTIDKGQNHINIVDKKSKLVIGESYRSSKEINFRALEMFNVLNFKNVDFYEVEAPKFRLTNIFGKVKKVDAASYFSLKRYNNKFPGLCAKCTNEKIFNNINSSRSNVNNNNNSTGNIYNINNNSNVSRSNINNNSNVSRSNINNNNTDNRSNINNNNNTDKKSNINNNNNNNTGKKSNINNNNNNTDNRSNICNINNDKEISRINNNNNTDKKSNINNNNNTDNRSNINIKNNDTDNRSNIYKFNNDKEISRINDDCMKEITKSINSANKVDIDKKPDEILNIAANKHASSNVLHTIYGETCNCSVDYTGTSTGHVYIKKSNKDLMKNIAVEMNFGEGRYSKTKIVNLYDANVIRNNTEYDFLIVSNTHVEVLLSKESRDIHFGFSEGFYIFFLDKFGVERDINFMQNGFVKFDDNNSDVLFDIPTREEFRQLKNLFIAENTKKDNVSSANLDQNNENNINIKNFNLSNTNNCNIFINDKKNENDNVNDNDAIDNTYGNNYSNMTNTSSNNNSNNNINNTSSNNNNYSNMNNTSSNIYGINNINNMNNTSSNIYGNNKKDNNMTNTSSNNNNNMNNTSSNTYGINNINNMNNTSSNIYGNNKKDNNMTNTSSNNNNNMNNTSSNTYGINNINNMNNTSSNIYGNNSSGLCNANASNGSFYKLDMGSFENVSVDNIPNINDHKTNNDLSNNPSNMHITSINNIKSDAEGKRLYVYIEIDGILYRLLFQNERTFTENGSYVAIKGINNTYITMKRDSKELFKIKLKMRGKQRHIDIIKDPHWVYKVKNNTNVPVIFNQKGMRNPEVLTPNSEVNFHPTSYGSSKLEFKICSTFLTHDLKEKSDLITAQNYFKNIGLNRCADIMQKPKLNQFVHKSNVHINSGASDAEHGVFSEKATVFNGTNDIRTCNKCAISNKISDKNMILENESCDFDKHVSIDKINIACKLDDKLYDKISENSVSILDKKICESNLLEGQEREINILDSTNNMDNLVLYSDQNNLKDQEKFRSHQKNIINNENNTDSNINSSNNNNIDNNNKNFIDDNNNINNNNNIDNINKDDNINNINNDNNNNNYNKNFIDDNNNINNNNNIDNINKDDNINNINNDNNNNKNNKNFIDDNNNINNNNKYDNNNNNIRFNNDNIYKDNNNINNNNIDNNNINNNNIDNINKDNNNINNNNINNINKDNNNINNNNIDNININNDNNNINNIDNTNDVEKNILHRESDSFYSFSSNSEERKKDNESIDYTIYRFEKENNQRKDINRSMIHSIANDIQNYGDKMSDCFSKSSRSRLYSKYNEKNHFDEKDITEMPEKLNYWDLIQKNTPKIYRSEYFDESKAVYPGFDLFMEHYNAKNESKHQLGLFKAVNNKTKQSDGPFKSKKSAAAGTRSSLDEIDARYDREDELIDLKMQISQKNNISKTDLSKVVFERKKSRKNKYFITEKYENYTRIIEIKEKAVNLDFKENIEEIQEVTNLLINVKIPFMAISLCDEEEIICMHYKGIDLGVNRDTKNNSEGYKCNLDIKSFQIDDQNLDSAFPVMLYPRNKILNFTYQENKRSSINFLRFYAGFERLLPIMADNNNNNLISNSNSNNNNNNSKTMINTSNNNTMINNNNSNSNNNNTMINNSNNINSNNINSNNTMINNSNNTITIINNNNDENFIYDNTDISSIKNITKSEEKKTEDSFIDNFAANWKIRDINLLIQAFVLQLDEKTCEKIASFFDYEQETSTFILCEKCRSDICQCLRVQKKEGKDLIIDSFYIHPLVLFFSLKKSSSTKGLKSMLLNYITDNISDFKINLSAQGLFRVENPIENLSEMIVTNYKGDVYSELIFAVGALDVLGNISSFKDTFSMGLKDLWYEPYLGLKSDDALMFGKGVLKGSSSLAKHTLQGIAQMFSRTTSGFSKTVGLVTFDKKFQNYNKGFKSEYVDDQRLFLPDIKGYAPKKVKPLTKGTERFLTSFVSGLKGVYKKPLEGVKKEGFGGFVKGIGKGSVGLFSKPIVGLLDFATGISDSITHNIDKTHICRLQYPRADITTTYNKSKNICQYIFNKFLKNNSDFFIDGECYENFHLILSNNHIFIVDKESLTCLNYDQITIKNKCVYVRDICVEVTNHLYDIILSKRRVFN